MRKQLIVSALAVGALAVPLAGSGLAGAEGSVGSGSSNAAASVTAGPGSLQADFAAAATQARVPLPVLLSVAYNESLWESHGGRPSTTGAYGVMALTSVPGAPDAAKGVAGAVPAQKAVAPNTVPTAAGLVGATEQQVRTDPATNVRAGATLLARYARQSNGGRLPSTVGGWYAAAARYSGSGSRAGATLFADDVFATIRTGAARRTGDGQQVNLAAQPAVRPDISGLAQLHLTADASTPRTECPRSISCNFVPAAYKLNDPADPTSYGNYDTANRPTDLKVDTIVLHDTESSYASTVATFTTSTSYVSAHYVVRSGDGFVTQFLPTKYVAWQAGNWYVNTHSVGIEQEGYAVEGATWYTEPLYHATSQLVRYLTAKYDVPRDRLHIIGHDNVPGIGPAHTAGMHWDPGPFWDWDRFMRLVGRPLHPTAGTGAPVVTIDPVFADNLQTVTDCEAHHPTPAQASSFVWLRTGPSADAPLYSDPGLHTTGPGTDCAADTGDKASAGQQYVVAGRQGDWTAIWYYGAKVWFANPAGSGRTALPTTAMLITPKDGAASIPTYGVAYPEASAYPADIPAQKVTPLQYSIAAGQSYVTSGLVSTDYYYAKSIDSSIPHDHTVVPGTDRYYRIQLGHRIGYVKAADVRLYDGVRSH